MNKMLDVMDARLIAGAEEQVSRAKKPTHKQRQIVLVFQGGGALGAYQAGVYQALHEAGIEPDWIIGTSIGAINASLIAGNKPENRLERLEEFWRRMRRKELWGLSTWPGLSDTTAYWSTLARRHSGFFEPNPLAFLGAHYPLGRDKAGFYSTAPLEKTLDRARRLCARQALHAAADSRRRACADQSDALLRQPRDGDHGSAYDGVRGAAAGLPGRSHRWRALLGWRNSFNTPTEAIFDDDPRRNSLIFAVHVWNPMGAEPETIWEVIHRQKDIQYSSRVASHIAKQRQVHKLRHVVSELVKFIPEERTRRSRSSRIWPNMAAGRRCTWCGLLAPRLDNENHTKDIDFSPNGIRLRWEAGYADTVRALQRRAWEDDCDPLKGVILHEPETVMP